MRPTQPKTSVTTPSTPNKAPKLSPVRETSPKKLTDGSRTPYTPLTPQEIQKRQISGSLAYLSTELKRLGDNMTIKDDHFTAKNNKLIQDIETIIDNYSENTSSMVVQLDKILDGLEVANSSYNALLEENGDKFGGVKVELSKISSSMSSFAEAANMHATKMASLSATMATTLTELKKLVNDHESVGRPNLGEKLVRPAQAQQATIDRQVYAKLDEIKNIIATIESQPPVKLEELVLEFNGIKGFVKTALLDLKKTMQSQVSPIIEMPDMSKFTDRIENTIKVKGEDNTDRILSEIGKIAELVRQDTAKRELAEQQDEASALTKLRKDLNIMEHSKRDLESVISLLQKEKAQMVPKAELDRAIVAAQHLVPMADIDRLKNEKSKLETENAQLEASIESLKEDLEEQKGVQSQLQSEIETHKKTLEVNIEANKEDKATISNLIQQISQQKGATKIHKDAAQTAEQKALALQTRIDEVYQERDEKISELQVIITDLQEQNAKLASQVFVLTEAKQKQPSEEENEPEEVTANDEAIENDTKAVDGATEIEQVSPTSTTVAKETVSDSDSEITPRSTNARIQEPIAPLKSEDEPIIKKKPATSKKPIAKAAAKPSVRAPEEKTTRRKPNAKGRGPHAGDD